MSEINAPRIVFFDGVCNLCNGSVRFLIRIDRKKRLLFGPLQSHVAHKLLGDVPGELHTIIYLRDGRQLEQSDAVLAILCDAGGIGTLAVLGYLIPRSWRNIIYRFIARHRYRLFGKRNSCMVPTKDIQSRFLD